MIEACWELSQESNCPLCVGLHGNDPGDTMTLGQSLVNTDSKKAFATFSKDFWDPTEIESLKEKKSEREKGRELY